MNKNMLEIYQTDLYLHRFLSQKVNLILRAKQFNEMYLLSDITVKYYNKEL